MVELEDYEVKFVTEFVNGVLDVMLEKGEPTYLPVVARHDTGLIAVVRKARSSERFMNKPGILLRYEDLEKHTDKCISHAIEFLTGTKQ